MPEETAIKIADWLSRRQSTSTGAIVDSVHQVTGTYSDGFAALVFALLDWPEPLCKALKISLARPLSSEFDGFAQALILHLGTKALGTRQIQDLKARPLYNGDQLVSNNWALFRALTRELRGKPGDFSLLGRQLPSGLFPDCPLGQATPTCYHAKICAIVALQSVLLGTSRHLVTLRSGLNALVAMISPRGVIAPYGRSRNTLFAYGSAYLALRLGAQLFQDGLYSWGSNQILRFITSFQQQDGHIPAVLNQNEWLREDWDVYINNPDYNAFAAACLLLASRLAPRVPTATLPEEGVADLGPILTVRTDGAYFACSTTGEFVPLGSPFFCDSRYAGVAPLLYDSNQHYQLFDQSYCWDGRDHTRKVLTEPAISDWIPFVLWGKRRYWVKRFSATAWSYQDRVLRLSGEGTPCFAKPRKAWRRFFDNKVRSKPALQMDLHPLHSPLTLDLELDFCTKRLGLSSTFPASPAMLKRSQLEEILGG